MVAVALSVAGSDPSGGAGLQGDLKTFQRHGVYGAAVPTLLTVQNTRGVQRVRMLDGEFVGAQLDAVLDDLPVAAAKTGALGSADVVRTVAQRFAARDVPLVVDPVHLASHGAALLEDEGRRALLEALLPAAALVTPNADEAAWLTGTTVSDADSAAQAARALLATGVGAVLIKGGHLPGPESVDFLCTEDRVQPLAAPRIQFGDRGRHGLGCALSSAITAHLAGGASLPEACRTAKAWLQAAIVGAPGLGEGDRPLDHLAPVPAGSDGDAS